MTEKTTKMLERVRALLAKAESTEFPAEADSFRAKADELMTAYAIEQWMVDQAQAGVGAVAKPERRDFDRSWRNSKFRTDLFYMFSSLASHCRCVVGIRGAVYESTPVYGLPSDLDYLDMLYTSLALEVAKNLQPSVDPTGDPGHEVFKQRQAGIGWSDITRKMYTAGLVAPTAANLKKYLVEPDLDWDTLVKVNKPWGEAPNIGWGKPGELGDLAMELKNKLANWNRKYVKEHGLQMDRNYVKPEVYQRSFMAGFSDEIVRRIRDMEARSRAAYDAEHDAGSMALAVRDIKSQALDLYNQEFPPPPPVEVRPGGKPGRKLAAPRPVRYDDSAMSAGRAKAREADLASKPGKRVGSRKQLED